MITFLSGKNDYAISQHIMKVRLQYQQKYADSLEAIECDLAELKYPDLEQALLAQPMFFSHRLVVVRSLTSATSYSDKLIDLIAKIPDSTVAILDGRGMDKRSVLYKKLVKLPGARLYEPLSESELVRWIQREAKRLDANVSQPITRHLLKRAGTDQWRLQGEIQKLAANQAEPTIETVNDLVAPDIQATIFDLISALQSQNAARGLQILDDLIYSGANEQQLIATLQWHYRVMALAVTSASEGDMIASGVKPYAASRVRGQASQLGLSGITRAYGLLLDADADIKVGNKKKHQALTDLVLSLATKV
ncbi:MAG: DNA polymerase III subunit delta [bacterium]